jgi:NADH dehydrogenase (ubiquinone) flavoprotein 1
MESILERLEKGDADLREIPMLEEISRGIEGIYICIHIQYIFIHT